MFIFFCLVIFILNFNAIGYDYLEFFASIGCINLQLWTSGDLPVSYRKKVSVFSSLLSWRCCSSYFLRWEKGECRLCRLVQMDWDQGLIIHAPVCRWSHYDVITWWWQDLIWFLQLRMTRSLLGSARPAANLLQKFSKLASESNSLVVQCVTVLILLQCYCNVLYFYRAQCAVFKTYLGK